MGASSSSYQPLPVDVETGSYTRGVSVVQPSAQPLPPTHAAEGLPSAPPLPDGSSPHQPLPKSPGHHQASTSNQAYYQQGYEQQGYGDFPVLHPMPQDSGLFGDAERKLRQGFVRKVLGIVSMQLLLTLVVGSWIVTSQPLQRRLTSSVPALIAIYASPFVVLLVLACSSSARHTYPLNLLLLAVFTVAESFAVGLASSQYNTAAVLGAIAITATLTLSLAAYALVTKSDLTTLGTGLFAVLTAVVVGSFLNIFLQVQLLDIIMSGVGAVLFSMYIVYDVQLLAGGQHTSAISPDEYILGALNIYLDILNLFLMILRLLGYFNDSN